MTISVTAPFRAAMSKGTVEPRFILSIYDGSNTYKAADGYLSQITDAPAAIRSVGGTSAKLHPIDRHVEIANCTVAVDLDWLRPIFTTTRLRGKRATITIGAAELAEVDFAGYFLGAIHAIKPDWSARSLILELRPALQMLSDAKVVGVWLAQHPLEAMKDILDKADIDASLIDASAFDPANAAYASISHFGVDRCGMAGAFSGGDDVAEPVPALDLLTELAKLLNGSIYVTAAGLISFKLFDATAAIAGTWTTDEINELEQLHIGTDPEDEELIVNRVSLSFDKCEHTSTAVSFSYDDTTAQGAIAYPGTSARVIDYSLETAWLGAHSSLVGNITGASISVFVGACVGWSGTISGGAERALSVGRPAYILVGGPPSSEAQEVIKATALTVTDAQHRTITNHETGNPEVITTDPGRLTFGTITRAQFGTTAVDHAFGAPARDFTVQANLLLALLARHRLGSPQIRVRTALSQYEYTYGDFIGITWSNYLDYDRDGLTTAVKWEITGKQLSEDKTEIEWELTLAATAALGATGGRGWGRAWPIVPDQVDIGTRETATGGEYFGRITRQSGLLVSATAGLGISVSAGVMSAATAAVTYPLATTYTVENNKDTYVYALPAKRALLFRAVATGAAAPTEAVGELKLAKVVASGGAVTSVTNLTTARQAIHGARIVDQSITDDRISTQNRYGSVARNGLFGQWFTR